MKTLLKALTLSLAGLTLLSRKEPAILLSIFLDKKETIEELSQTKFKDFIGSRKDSPLVKHMNTFAGEDGYITKKSIFEASIKKWHLDESQANTLALGTLKVAWLRQVPGVHFSLVNGMSGGFLAKDAVDLLTHPSDTGLYDMTGGTVNADRFDELEKYATTDENGEKLISQTSLTKYLTDWYRVDNRWQHSTWLNKFIGSAGNKGEYEIFFSKCGSRWLPNPETNQMEPAITLSELKYFLTDSYSMVKAVETHSLPAKPISFWNKVTNSLTSYAKEVVEQCPSYFPENHSNYWSSNTSLFYRNSSVLAHGNNVAPIGQSPSAPAIGR